jgi:hypothetical protein
MEQKKKVEENGDSIEMKDENIENNSTVDDTSHTEIEESPEEIKLQEDELFLRSMLPRDDNEKRRVVIALHRTYIIDRTGR